MSGYTPKVGDRVRMVHREGVVTSVDSGIVGVRYDDGLRTNVWSWEVEQVRPPLPTTPGSVIRTKVGGELALRTRIGWRWETGETRAAMMNPDSWDVIFDAGVSS